MKKLSIIIPAYNEATSIHEILDKIQNVKLYNGIEKEVIIVNDCSSDETKMIIKEQDLSIQINRENSFLISNFFINILIT